MHPDITKCNAAQAPEDRAIRDLFAREIDRHLPEAEGSRMINARAEPLATKPASWTAFGSTVAWSWLTACASGRRYPREA